MHQEILQIETDYFPINWKLERPSFRKRFRPNVLPSPEQVGVGSKVRPRLRDKVKACSIECTKCVCDNLVFHCMVCFPGGLAN